ncbi:MAG: hypothetical protein UT01_C0051G0004 [Candidatus Daviesbacteria bacterium GW2011_GWA1_38_7]|nr:MAG: hypothetical protein UT01_C0051G0004 [Candidatus Daviesbacteria bacterium GW2011_GWA1_38_7]
MIQPNMSVGYLEKPATEDEKVIARLLEDAILGLNARKFRVFSKLFSDEAMITPAFGDGTPVSKEIYINQLIKSSSSILRYLLENVLIRVTSSSADVFARLCVFTLGNLSPRISERHFHFTKNGEIWHIDKSSRS